VPLTCTTAQNYVKQGLAVGGYGFSVSSFVLAFHMLNEEKKCDDHFSGWAVLRALIKNCFQILYLSYLYVFDLIAYV